MLKEDENPILVDVDLASPLSVPPHFASIPDPRRNEDSSYIDRT